MAELEIEMVMKVVRVPEEPRVECNVVGVAEELEGREEGGMVPDVQGVCL